MSAGWSISMAARDSLMTRSLRHSRESTSKTRVGAAMMRWKYGTLAVRKVPVIMMTSWNGTIFCVTGPLCGEFTCHRWSPHTKASGAESEVFVNRSHYDVIAMTHMHYFCEMNQLTQRKPRDWRPLCSICNVICLIAVNYKYITTWFLWWLCRR